MKPRYPESQDERAARLTGVVRKMRLQGGGLETWWSSVESYFGISRPRWRGRELSDDHEILALADEAGSLPEAITGYRSLVDPKKHQSADFLDIVQAFDRWQAALESASCARDQLRT